MVTVGFGCLYLAEEKRRRAEFDRSVFESSRSPPQSSGR